MKKLVFGLILIFSCLSARADLCLILTKDPRFAVSSYIRNQTACRTTSQVGLGSLGSQLARLGTIMIVASAISYLVDQNNRLKVEKIISDDYQTLSCQDRSRTVKFLVGKESAINQDSGKIYDRIQDGVFRAGMFTSYQLNVNTMSITGSGGDGPANFKCSVIQQIKNGQIEIDNLEEA